MDRGGYLFDPRPHADRSHYYPLTLAGCFARAVARAPARPAIIDGELRLSWADLHRRVHRLATMLAARGLGTGDVIGLGLPNSWEFVAGHLAIAAIGAVTLPLHVAYGDAEISGLLGRTGARAAIVLAPRAAFADLETLVVCNPTASRLAANAFALAAIFREPSDRPPTPRIDPDDPFVLAPTSGTESTVPKICMHAHAGLLSNATEVARESQLGPGDVVLAAGGFTHLFGLLAVHAAIVRGATLVAQARYDPDRFLELCVRERVTHAWAVPAQLHDLAERAGNGEIVSVPDARLGERATLVCTLHERSTLTLGDVKKFLQTRGVAKYKWPERLLVLDELPLTPSGKVAKAAVRGLAARAAS